MTFFTVFTGGTISCSLSGDTLSPDAQNGYYLLDLARRAGARAAFETAQPYLLLSENLDMAHLEALGDCIRKAIDRGFDRIIVTHGTDTLQYTAAYLDLIFGGTDVAIALVSANYPLRDPRSNGLANFMAAALLLRTEAETGVFVPYQNTGDGFVTVHRGFDLLPHLPYDDALKSVFGTPYGYVRGGAFEREAGYQGSARDKMPECTRRGRVLYLRPYVGMGYPRDLSGVGAVLLEGWHSGTLPTASAELADFCRRAGESGVPLYLTGSTEGFNYESKREFDRLGITVLPPASPIAAYVFLVVSSQ